MKIVSSILGLTTLVLACLSLSLYVLAPNNQMLVAGMWIATALFFLGWVILNRKMLLQFFTKKSTLYGANQAFIVLLVLGILVCVNYAAKEHSFRKDFTRSGLNSLSPQTKKVLRELDKEVKVFYFNSQQEKEKNEAIFKNYAHETKRFRYQFVDTGKEPTLTQSMEVKRNDTAIFILDGTNKKVKVEGATEEKLTNGLIKLLRTKDQIVYFTSGHLEKRLDSSDTDADGLSFARAELEKQGYSVKELNLMSAGKIPDDISVLGIVSPQSAFYPKEIEIIGEWMAKGGSVFIALDLDVVASGLSKGAQQIASIAKKYGVEVHDKMLVDPTSKAANVEPQVLLGFSASKEHPITKDFPTSTLGIVANFFFPLTSYLTNTKIEGIETTSLAKTSQQAWAISDWATLKKGLVSFQKGKDLMGQMDLAYAVEKAAEKIRMVIFANARFAVNGVIDKAANRDLFLNSFAWLTKDEQFISIRAKEQDNDQLQASNNMLSLVFILTVLFLPVFVLVYGLVVWWRRSKQ